MPALICVNSIDWSRNTESAGVRPCARRIARRWRWFSAVSGDRIVTGWHGEGLEHLYRPHAGTTADPRERHRAGGVVVAAVDFAASQRDQAAGTSRHQPLVNRQS